MSPDKHLANSFIFQDKPLTATTFCDTTIFIYLRVYVWKSRRERERDVRCARYTHDTSNLKKKRKQNDTIHSLIRVVTKITSARFYSYVSC